jgi:hypothetical protein
MRKSDENKNPFQNSHDRQIGETLHDKILYWLFHRLNEDHLDLVARVTGASENEICKIKVEIESPVYGGFNMRSILGFVDLKVTAFENRMWETEECESDEEMEEEFYLKEFSGFIEIKSHVNVGETIRQIKYYGGNPWTVCGPDNGCREILDSQGIQFIEYAP